MFSTIQTNEKLMNHFGSMTHHEKFNAAMRDPLTGAYNRRAFDLTYEPGTPVLFADLDSLKFINDDQAFGHRVGDAFLCRLVNDLSSVGLSVYRLGCGSDEFAALGGESMIEIHHLARKVWTNTPFFSWGTGFSLNEADRDLGCCKIKHEYFGKRVARGEIPPWINEIKRVSKFVELENRSA